MLRKLLGLMLFAGAGLSLVGCQSAGSSTASAPAALLSSEATLPRGFNPVSYQHVIDTLCRPEMEGRDAGTRGIELARDYLVERFKEAGLEPAFIVDGKPSYTQPLVISIRPGGDGDPVETSIENVGGLLPGVGELADEIVVVGAHYDHIGYGHFGSRDPNGHGHIHPGADDNASGTAGVVLLADRFARDAKARTSTRSPRRTILFTGFAGEERGLIGSRYMNDHPDQWAFDASKVSGMINMDMIGRLRAEELYVFSHRSGQQWRGWVERANGPVGLDVKLDIAAPGGSDHMAFIRAGIPAVFFNTWLHEDVHTPNDTPDKINAKGSIRVLALVGSVLERATTNVERVTLVPPPLRPFIGVMLGQSSRGLVLQRVLDGGPLDQAGAEDGDVLVQFGENSVAGPGPLRRLIRQAKPGEKVMIQVLRGEETVELELTVGGRP